jgi:hypothetical protein
MDARRHSGERQLEAVAAIRATSKVDGISIFKYGPPLGTFQPSDRTSAAGPDEADRPSSSSGLAAGRERAECVSRGDWGGEDQGRI